jgi:thymidylate synthase ThyX
MRYIRFEDLPYWIPTSIQGIELDDIHNLSQEEELIWKKQQSRFVFHKAFDYAQGLYQELMDIWKDELAPESKFAAKKQITSMMRRIIPMGVATGGIWTGNIRALRHVIAMRTSPAAEEEICYVFSNVIKMMADLEPNFFGDFQELEGGFWVPKYVKV